MTELCWACGKENKVKDMVFSKERYICSTKECLLAAFEKTAEELELILYRK